jgi:hypothetical protein
MESSCKSHLLNAQEFRHAGAYQHNYSLPVFATTKIIAENLQKGIKEKGVATCKQCFYVTKVEKKRLPRLRQPSLPGINCY